MDFLKSQFDRISAQLSALTPTQKMLTAALVVIMVMTLMWWSRYAGTAEMEPFLDQSLSPEDMSRIEATLTQKNIEFKPSNDRILVPADRKSEAMVALALNDALPKDTSSGFDEMLKQLSPWDGVGKQNAVYNHAKEMDLSRYIGMFPGVAWASVTIDAHAERHIGADIESKASVVVKMKPNVKASKQLVKGAASLVAGAQAGLDMKNIKIVVDGFAQKVSDADPDADGIADAGSMLEARENAEKFYTEKVAKHLEDIPGVEVSVTVSINDESSDTDQTRMDEKNTLHLEKEVSNETQEQTTPAAVASEPGTAPNTGQAITPGAAGGGEGTSNNTKERSSFEILPSVIKQHIRLAAGTKTIPTGASIRIPHDHFVMVARTKAHGSEPDAQTLQLTTDDERKKTADAVAKTLGLANVADVSVVEFYPDALPTESAAAPVTAASTFTLALGGHVKEIALGALALVSLFMVSSMVKKTGPMLPAAVAAAPAASPRNILAGSELVAGEAGEGGTLLNAVEMDEDSVRNQQMMEQVATLVDENPDTAATLVKRWMNRT